MRIAGLVSVLLFVDCLMAHHLWAQGRPVVIGYQETPDWSLFVARELKLYEKAGLSPSFVKFDSGLAMVQAVQTAGIELASVGATTFLTGLSEGLDWVMIGITSEGAYGQGLVVRKDSRTRTAGDLIGKRVAVQKGSTAEVGLMMMLRQHGVRLDQVTLVDMRPETQAAALEHKQVEAAMTWQPWIQKMVREAHGRLVETEGSLGIYNNVDCYSVRRQWLRDNRETALRFLRAQVAANDLVRKDPTIAQRIWSRELGLKETWAEQIFDASPPPLIHEWTNPRYAYSLVKGAPLHQRLGFLANFMRDQGLIARTVSVEDAMDSSLIAEVLSTSRARR